MKFYLFQQTALLASLIPTIVAQSGQQFGNCTVFNLIDKEFYTRYASRPERISGAITCPQKQNITHNCPLTADGDLLVTWSTNTSAILKDNSWGTESFLHNLIRNAVNGSLNDANPDFNRSIIGVIDTTIPVSPGTSGYINFFPLMRCVEGTMSNCTGGLEDGLAVEACAPVANVDGGLRILSGNAVLQNVSESNVTNFRDPFANQSRGAAGQLSVSAWGLVGSALIGIGLISLL